MDVELLLHLGDAACDLEREHGACEAAAVAEDADALALRLLIGNIGNQAGQAAVDAAAVHVSALCRHLDAWLDASLESLLGESHKCLLDCLVCDGRLVVQVPKLGGHVGEDGVGGVLEVVVIEQACI